MSVQCVSKLIWLCVAEELIKILEKLWFHSDAPGRPDHLRTEESRILPDFLRLMIEVLYPVCRDLLELQRLLREMLPKAAAQMKHEMQQAKNSEGRTPHARRRDSRNPSISNIMFIQCRWNHA